MSPRAASRLESIGFEQVYDYVAAEIATQLGHTLQRLRISFKHGYSYRSYDYQSDHLGLGQWDSRLKPFG